MKSKTIKTLIGISLILGGCNPYAAEFRCGKDTPFGSCASTPEIYSEITMGSESERAAGPGSEVEAKKYLPPVSQTAANAYQEASLAKVASLLKKPVTPIITPPTVGCVWFPPMLGESTDTLNMDQYVCIMMDTARFVMGDYLNRGE